MGEPSQTNIKIDKVLWDDLVGWLETPQAKKLGYHSRAQFATEAIRELLEKKKKSKDDEYKKILQKLNSIESKLDKTSNKHAGKTIRTDQPSPKSK